MTCNIGKADKTIRIIAGIVLIGAGVYFQSWWGALGIIPLTTGLINSCPMYSLFGVSTQSKKF